MFGRRDFYGRNRIAHCPCSFFRASATWLRRDDA